jgi:hypothetical protein
VHRIGFLRCVRKWKVVKENDVATELMPLAFQYSYKTRENSVRGNRIKFLRHDGGHVRALELPHSHTKVFVVYDIVVYMLPKCFLNVLKRRAMQYQT